jgi:hypothetical protein
MEGGDFQKDAECLEENREILHKLPELLLNHLDFYKKAHEDDSTEVSRSLKDGNFQDDIENFKVASFEFVELLTKLKQNFTTILSRPEVETPTIFDDKKPSNFDLFVAEQCQKTVSDKVSQIASRKTYQAAMTRFNVEN